MHVLCNKKRPWPLDSLKRRPSGCVPRSLTTGQFPAVVNVRGGKARGQKPSRGNCPRTRFDDNSQVRDVFNNVSRLQHVNFHIEDEKMRDISFMASLCAHP